MDIVGASELPGVTRLMAWYQESPKQSHHSILKSSSLKVNVEDISWADF